MRIHHLNCATMCPVGGRLLGVEGPLWVHGTLICHCLLVESDAGLILVDTGIGLADIAHPRRQLGGFVWMMRPRLDADETALHQLVRLGFSRDDVRHIVVTHLDLDHAGGIADFPRAKVHVYDAEHTAAMSRTSVFERLRYRPVQWAHGPDWVRYVPRGEPWFGFECVRQMEGLPPEMLLVPLVGHTRGHCGVAVSTSKGWLLHAGDAYFFHGEMDPAGRHCPPGFDAFQRFVEIDAVMRRKNQQRLRALVSEHQGEVTVFCAHDPVELDKARSAQSIS